MPAEPLFKAICKKASGRVAISDVAESMCAEAKTAGVVATEAYVDYFPNEDQHRITSGTF